MKAMVLAAGRGTRLGALGRATPKCLLEAGGRSLLERIAGRLRAAGVTHLVVNLHHLGEQVERHVRDRAGFGLDVRFSREAELLDTGGGVRRAAPLLVDPAPVVVHNGDIYCDLDLGALLTFQAERAPAATVVTRETDDPKVLLFDRGGLLGGWRNRATGEELLVGPRRPLEPRGFAAIQVLSQGFLAGLAGEPERFSMIQALLHAADRGEPVLSWPADDAFWIDVGTEEKLAALRARVAAKGGPS